MYGRFTHQSDTVGQCLWVSESTLWSTYVELFLLLRAAMGGRRVRCSGGSDTLITVTKTKTKINTIELYNNTKKLRKNDTKTETKTIPKLKWFSNFTGQLTCMQELLYSCNNFSSAIITVYCTCNRKHH